jgi:hypothetical protein
MKRKLRLIIHRDYHHRVRSSITTTPFQGVDEDEIQHHGAYEIQRYKWDV